MFTLPQNSYKLYVVFTLVSRLVLLLFTYVEVSNQLDRRVSATRDTVSWIYKNLPCQVFCKEQLIKRYMLSGKEDCKTRPVVICGCDPYVNNDYSYAPGQRLD